MYSLGQLHLIFSYFNRKKASTRLNNGQKFQPKVTIQLPIYNESNVVERLIESVCNIAYPKELLEIQVLDDSTDICKDIALKKVQEFQQKGFDIKHIQRQNRKGFKAGALQHGLQFCSGEFIAIFDADFLPEENFLSNTLAEFTNPEVGVVQTRWGHTNSNFSWLTKAQAFGLDAHFTVEQSGRYKANCFISFNGTAGVWRKTCIEEAGGWQADTLTEDLDLSYRAQLKGWQFVYLEDTVSPAELPITIAAFKSQQYRWNKGAAETHKKVWKDLWQAKLPWGIKAHAILQLFKGWGFVSSFVLTMVTIPLMWLKSFDSFTILVLQALSFTLLCVIILGSFYYASLQKIHSNKKDRLKYFAANFPMFIAISMGSNFHNCVAVLDGYFGSKTPFIRTPKFNWNKSDSDNAKFRLNFRELDAKSILEGLLAMYFLFGVAYGFYLGDFTFIPFHILLFVGYGYFFWKTLASPNTIKT